MNQEIIKNGFIQQNKIMKVLHITDHLGIGGTSTLIKDIFHTQQHNKDIFCYVLRKNKFEKKLEHPNLYIYNKFSRYSLGSIFQLKSVIQKNNIELLHCHLLKSQMFGWVVKKIFFPKIKLVFHIHSSGLLLNTRYYPKLLKSMKGNVDLFVVVSASLKRYLDSLLPEEKGKTVVLYNAIDLSDYKTEHSKKEIEKVKNKLLIDKENFIIGFVGRLTKEKGCMNLIKAMAKLPFHYHLLIIGDGPFKKDLVNEVNRANIAKRVRFLGARRDMDIMYSIMDILAVPSHYEGFSVTLLESQAFSLPVVASDIPGIREIIKDGYNGLLFNSKNIEDLAKKIKLLAEDNEAREKMRQNAKSVIQNYPFKKYIDQLSEIYIRLNNP